MASALYQSIELLSREKGIEPEIVVGAVEEAIALATRKYYKTQENMRGELNKETGITLRLPPIAPGKATTVQVRDGRAQVKNGPHLAEGVGGAFVLEAENIEAAIALGARIPQARLGGAVEIRPVESYF